jgi:hypothetical protein
VAKRNDFELQFCATEKPTGESRAEVERNAIMPETLWRAIVNRHTFQSFRSFQEPQACYFLNLSPYRAKSNGAAAVADLEALPSSFSEVEVACSSSMACLSSKRSSNS